MRHRGQSCFGVGTMADSTAVPGKYHAPQHEVNDEAQAQECSSCHLSILIATVTKTG